MNSVFTTADLPCRIRWAVNYTTFKLGNWFIAFVGPSCLMIRDSCTEGEGYVFDSEGLILILRFDLKAMLKIRE